MTRWIPRLIHPDYINGDTYFHLELSDQIRANNQKVPRILDRIYFQYEHSYPSLFHRFFALFDYQTKRQIEKMVAPVTDTIYVLVAYAFGLLIQKNSLELSSFSFYTLDFAELSAALFMLYPGLIVLGIGPRIFSGSPRIIGQLIFATIIYLFAYLVTNHYQGLTILAPIISILVCAMPNLGRFNNQILIFSAIGMTIFGYFLYPILIVVGYCLAFLIGRGQFLKLIDQHLEFLKFIVERNFNYKKRKINKSSLYVFYVYPSVMYLVRTYNNLRSLRPQKILMWIFKEQYVVHILITVFFTFLIVFFAQSTGIIEGQGLELMYQYSILGIVLFLITSIHPFTIVGRAERYLEFYALPSLIIFVAYCAQSKSMWLLYSYIAVSVITYGVSLLNFHDQAKRWNVNLELRQEFFEKLNKLPKGLLLPIKDHWMSYHLAKTHELLFFPVSPVATHIPFQDAVDLIHPYNSVLEKRYSINYAVGEDYHLQHFGWKDSENYVKVLEGGGLEAYQKIEL